MITWHNELIGPIFGYFRLLSSRAIAAICSTLSWWAPKSLSNASCRFRNAYNSFFPKSTFHSKSLCWLLTETIKYQMISILTLFQNKWYKQTLILYSPDDLQSDDCKASSLPWVHSSCNAHLRRNFSARCSRRSSLYHVINVNNF